MGYVDPLGRFIRDPDVDSLDGISSTNRKTSSNPIQFLTNLVRNDQDELVKFSYLFDYLNKKFSSSFFRQWKKQQLDLLKPLLMK